METQNRGTITLRARAGGCIRKKLTWEGLDEGTKVLAGRNVLERIRYRILSSCPQTELTMFSVFSLEEELACLAFNGNLLMDTDLGRVQCQCAFSYLLDFLNCTLCSKTLVSPGTLR